MSPTPISPNVDQLAQAGLVNPANLSDADREVIAQLSDAEVTTLISIATRLYADNPSMRKEIELKEGKVRLMVPL
jgi:hypothetical protein